MKTRSVPLFSNFARILPTILLLCSLIALGFLTTISGLQTTVNAQTTWNLAWQDNFDGAVGSKPDSTKWGYDLGGGGWGNSELEYYTSDAANAQVVNDSGAQDGKALAIKAIYNPNSGLNCWYGPCTYTSARLLTRGKVDWKFGKIELRAKVPTAAGLWPAFWMLGSNIDTVPWPNCGEIDIMEQIGLHDNWNYGTIHGPGYSGSNGVGAQYVLPSGRFADAYHTFTIEWAPSVIRWYVDGILYSTKTPSDIPAGTTWVYDHNFFILLNMAVGNNAGWPGVADSTQYPQTMLVDYVRVWQDPNIPTLTPTSTPGASTPFSGTPIALPGRIEAENYDLGGEWAAYHDFDAGNNGGAYRTDGVDIQACTDVGCGYNVGYIVAGDWMKYTVNTASTGQYILNLRVANQGLGGTFHIEQDNVDITGPLTIPNTGAYQTYTTLTKTGVTLNAGQHVLRFVMEKGNGSPGNGNLNWFEFVGGAPVTNTFTPTPTRTPTPTATQVSGNGNPYGGTAASVPGTVEAENFNTGGEGVAYHDTTTGNTGNQYRTTEAVDIQGCTDTGCGFNVGWTVTGEWMKYTVNVTTAGTYSINFRVASAGTGGTFHLEVDGANASGTMTVPNTGGWQTWTTITKTGVALTAGQHVLRLVMDNVGGNFNWISFTNGGTPTNTPTNTQVPTFQPPTNTPSGSGHSNVLYVIDGASTTTAGPLAFTAGTAANTDTIPSAGGTNHDGTPANQISYVISGVSGTYDSTKTTQFAMFIDAGAAVGNGQQVRVSYDFTGDGTYDRTETYNYFATDPATGFENYSQTKGLKSSTGSFANLSNGKIRIEVWSAIGNAASSLRTSASSANGQQSTLTIPFNNVTG